MGYNWEPIDILKGGVDDITSKLLKDPKIYAEKILNARPVTATITMPVQALSHDGNAVISKTVTIPFYMGNDFNVGTLTNKWSDLVNLDFANSFTELLNMLSAQTGSAQVSMQSEAMSLQSWKGSSYDGFSVECLFIATNRSINPTKIIRQIAASALPTKLKGDNTAAMSANAVREKTIGVLDIVKNRVGGIATESGSIADTAKNAVTDGVTAVENFVEDLGMVAPLHYGISLDTNEHHVPYKPVPNTTLTLQIGEYFRAEELIVKSIGGITFSKEIIAPKAFNHRKSGDLYDPSSEYSNHSFPLWGKCTLSLAPCSMLTKEKFESYFLDPYDDTPELFKNGLSNILNNVFDNPTSRTINSVVSGTKNFVNQAGNTFREWGNNLNLPS